MLNVFRKHDEASRKNWAMAWGAGGRQNDSPAGRYHDEKALAAFRQLSCEEKAQLDPETRQNYEAYATQEDIS
jgi:hypothetical protein